MCLYKRIRCLQLQSDLKETKTELDNLRQKAQKKLSEAATHYMQLKESSGEKDAAISSLNKDLSEWKTRADNNYKDTLLLREQSIKLKQQVQTLQSDLSEKDAELLAVTNKHNLSTTELENCKKREQELNTISQKYKSQLVEAREKLHERSLEIKELEDKLNSVNVAGNTGHLHMDAMSKYNALEVENKSLKSKVVELLNKEAMLEDKLNAGGMSEHLVAERIEVRAKVQQYENDLILLQGALETKEKENKELETICNELLTQLEIMKQT
jgi:chromosome segregation ATPase